MKQHEKIVKKSKVLNILLGLLIFFMLIMNLIYSQLISPIYFRFVNNDKNATINFLEKIKTFPEFQKILEINKNIYGKTLEKETFRQENEKKLMINNFEQKLSINARARDVLYGLYQLYSSENNTKMAEKYLEQAREIDPSL